MSQPAQNPPPRRGGPQARPATTRRAVPRQAAVKPPPRLLSRRRVTAGVTLGTLLTIVLGLFGHWPATWLARFILEVVTVVVITGIIVAWRQGHLSELSGRAQDRYRQARAGDTQPSVVLRPADDDDAEDGDDLLPWQPARPRPAASGPAGRRAAARARASLAARQIAVPKTGAVASPEFTAAADKIREFRSDDGEELQAWLDELSAGLYAIGEAISDAHDGMVNDTGLDEIPAAAVHDVADQVVEVGGQVLEAKDAILRYYDDPINFADSGGKMPKDGRFWEQR